MPLIDSVHASETTALGCSFVRMIQAERAFNDSITREMPVKRTLAPTSVPISQGSWTLEQNHSAQQQSDDVTQHPRPVLLRTQPECQQLEHTFSQQKLPSNRVSVRTPVKGNEQHHARRDVESAQQQLPDEASELRV